MIFPDPEAQDEVIGFKNIFIFPPRNANIYKGFDIAFRTAFLVSPPFKNILLEM